MFTFDINNKLVKPLKKLGRSAFFEQALWTDERLFGEKCRQLGRRERRENQNKNVMASLPNLKKVKTASDAKRTERKGKKNDSKLPREDITFLLMNTRFSEQEIRYT